MKFTFFEFNIAKFQNFFILNLSTIKNFFFYNDPLFALNAFRAAKAAANDNHRLCIKSKP